MPSSRKARQKILEVLPEKGTVYELGSGFGHLLYLICKKSSHYKIHGFEISFFPYLFSKSLELFFPSLLSIRRKNFYDVSLQEADIVVCYLFPQAMSLLRKKLETELKEGALVISNTFSIIGWKPIQVIEIKDLFRSKIYIYQKRTAVS